MKSCLRLLNGQFAANAVADVRTIVVATAIEGVHIGERLEAAR